MRYSMMIVAVLGYVGVSVSPFTGQRAGAAEGETAFQSGLFMNIEYDPAAGSLQLTFKNGHVYEYFNVPEDCYREFQHADSWKIRNTQTGCRFINGV